MKTTSNRFNRNNRVNHIKLCLENLETRLNPAMYTTNGVLVIIGTPQNDYVVVNQVGDSLNVTNNKYTANFGQVTKIVAYLSNGNNFYLNNTNVPSQVFDGVNGSVLTGGTGNDQLYGGDSIDSQDVLSDVGGSNLLVGGNNGKGTRFVGGVQADTILGGNTSQDRIYDIVGTNYIDSGPGSDVQIVNANGFTQNNPDDTTVLFKNRNTPVTLENGVIYVQGDANENMVTLNESNGKITVNYTDLTGTQSFVYNSNQVKYIGASLGAGNDQFFNNTLKTPSVAYGSDGEDTLSGSPGAIDILKGGNQQDLVFAQGLDDVSGNGDLDVLVLSGGQNLVRSDDLDVVFGDLANDVFVNGSRWKY